MDEIRRMTPSDIGYYSLPPADDWQETAFPRDVDSPPVWTPSKGVNPDVLPKAWGTTNFNSTTKNVRSVATPKTPEHPSSALSSPSKKKEKILFKQILAGDSQSYENRQIQRARDMMSASTNFAFFPPSQGAPMSPPPGAQLGQELELDVDEDDDVDYER